MTNKTTIGPVVDEDGHSVVVLEERRIGTDQLIATWAVCSPHGWQSEREVIDATAVIVGEATDEAITAHRRQHAADRLGNTVAREGCDRCTCGSKYWERDRCVDCGAHVASVRPDIVSPVEIMRTPQLVREYAEHKMSGARGDRLTREAHNRLGAVVDELRNRGVLD